MTTQTCPATGWTILADDHPLMRCMRRLGRTLPADTSIRYADGLYYMSSKTLDYGTHFQYVADAVVDLKRVMSRRRSCSTCGRRR